MISKDEFMAVAVISIDEQFPKGVAKERGEAMMVIANLLRYLQEHGAVGSDNPRHDPKSGVLAD